MQNYCGASFCQPKRARKEILQALKVLKQIFCQILEDTLVKQWWDPSAVHFPENNDLKAKEKIKRWHQTTVRSAGLDLNNRLAAYQKQNALAAAQ